MVPALNAMLLVFGGFLKLFLTDWLSRKDY